MNTQTLRFILPNIFTGVGFEPKRKRLGGSNERLCRYAVRLNEVPARADKSRFRTKRFGRSSTLVDFGTVIEITGNGIRNAPYTD